MNIKKKYILINSEKLLISTWLKVVIFFALNALFTSLMTFVANSISSVFNIEPLKVFQVTLFINVFVILALIYDLIPKFKKIIAISFSVFYSFMYMGISNDPLYIDSMLLILFMVFLNIIFNKRIKNKPHPNNIKLK